MQHQLFAHRRMLVAASLAGAALLVFAPKSYGKIPDGPGASVREQPTREDPTTMKLRWSSQREQSSTNSPAAVREQAPSLMPPTRIASQILREDVPESNATTATRAPATSDWGDELALGSSLVVVLAAAAGITLMRRNRQMASPAG